MLQKVHLFQHLHPESVQIRAEGVNMTREDVNDTISALRLAITVKAKQGLTVNEIRMGYELLQTISAFNSLVTNRRFNTDSYFIFGIPVVVDYVNPMRLEIAIVEPVRVWQTYKGGSEDDEREMD